MEYFIQISDKYPIIEVSTHNLVLNMISWVNILYKSFYSGEGSKIALNQQYIAIEFRMFDNCAKPTIIIEIYLKNETRKFSCK